MVTSIRSLRFAVVCAVLSAILLGTPAASFAAMKVSFDLKSGSHVADVANIVAQVTGSTDVDQVQFYVDDKLVATVTGVPYQFGWDTIKTTEGTHELKAVATDDSGNTASAAVSLVVDNDLSLGGVALAQKAADALQQGDLDGARRWARRAVKADNHQLEALMVLANLDARGHNFTKAVARLKGNPGLDKNPDALTALATYQMHVALDPANVQQLVAMVKSAAQMTQQAADLRIAADQPNTAAIGDEYLNSGRPAQAIQAYKNVSASDLPPLDLAVKLALAEVLSHQYVPARTLMDNERNHKQDSSALRAVYGLCLLRQHHVSQAGAMVAADAAKGIPASMVIASYAALQEGHVQEANDMASAAAAAVPEAGDTNFALAMGATLGIIREQSLTKAIVGDPLQPGPYLIYASQLALLAGQQQPGVAQGIATFCRSLDPGALSPRLLEGLLAVDQKNLEQGKALLNATSLSFPAMPDLYYAMSAYCSAAQLGGPSTQFLDKAAKLDRTDFGMDLPPNPAEAIRYLFLTRHYRPGFFLSLKTLAVTGTSQTATMP